MKRNYLLFILCGAFLLRFGLSSHPGYEFDSILYQSWAESAVELGVAASYSEQVSGYLNPDYPPASMLLFAGFGHIYKALYGEFDLKSTRLVMFMKLPGILADVLICALLYIILSRWKSIREGHLGALAYALNPAALYDTAIWGQTDSIFSLLLLAAIFVWTQKHRDIAAVLLALSILVKFQAIVLFPLFAFLLIREPRALLRFTIIGILTVLTVLIPFLQDNAITKILEVYTGSVGRYAHLSTGAYNFWWSLLGDNAWHVLSTDSPFGLMSYSKWGFLLFGAMYAAILWTFEKALWEGKNIIAFYYCSALLAAAFFLFLPQMHERYLFPFVVLGMPIIFISRTTMYLYWAMVVAFTMNLMGILPYSFIDKGLYRVFDTLDVVVAVSMVWLFGILVFVAKKYV